VKKLLGFAIVIVALLGALGVLLDFFAKSYTEDQIGTAITHNSKSIGYATASIDSFPYTWKLLKDGRIEHLKVALTNLTGIDAAIDELDVQIDGLEMDKSALLGSDHVQINHVDGVTVTAVLSTTRLRDAAGKLGIDLAFGNGTMTVSGVPITLVVEGTDLVLQGGSLPAVRLPIPVADVTLLPCVPSPTVTPKGVDLSCHADHLPKVLVDAIGSVDLKQQLPG
jgi:hypothetical protein